MRQLDQRALSEARAASGLEFSRKANKSYFDDVKRQRLEHQQLRVGDLVLLFNQQNEKWRAGRKLKLVDNWFGPYRIWEASPAGYYRLEELDGTQSAQSVAGNRLKRFFTRRMRESTVTNTSVPMPPMSPMPPIPPIPPVPPTRRRARRGRATS